MTEDQIEEFNSKVIFTLASSQIQLVKCEKLCDDTHVSQL